MKFLIAAATSWSSQIPRSAHFFRRAVLRLKAGDTLEIGLTDSTMTVKKAA
jgi:hypothetical protein